MGWKKPSLLKIITGGLYKDKDMNTDADCPWKHDCPRYMREERISHDLVRKVPRSIWLPSKLILVEQVQPYVKLYKCGYCGLKFFVDVDGRSIPEEHKSHLKNPALIGGRKGDSIWR